MPLFEFLRLARGKLESAKQKPPCTSDLSPVPENELVELVWENGQIMMQGQYDRAKKSPDLNDFPSETPGFQDKYTGCATTPKVGKFGLVESILNDAPSSVPSGEIYVNQEDEMVPWLDYSIDDNFKQNLGSEILPEISGVTGNEPSSHTCFTSMGNENCNEMFQHSHTVPVHNAVNLEEQNASKVSSSRTGLLSPNSSQRCQISVPSTGSGFSNIFMNTASNSRGAFLGDSIQDQASIGGFICVKMQKQKIGLSDSRSNLLNFSHFSRPAALLRANLEKTDGLAASHLSGIEKTGNEKVPAASSSTPIKSTKVKPSNKTRKEICWHNRPKLSSTKVDSRPPVVKPPEESCSAEQADALHWEDSIKNDKSSNPVIGAGTTKEVTEGENPVEPVVAASSVCSGNSGEGASSDQMHNLKRKQREYDESESRSEEIEEESVGIKKAAHARGVSGSKRSRAAEVHNLSERRRRDRINEKMRALQELIPNCNKADKASMLDEAIEYLKMLQFQVQMMSMGAGLCMPPMMYPTGLQHMHTAHMPHFSPLGGGMGMGMGYGMGMLMSSASPRFPIFPVPPMHGAHFPYPPLSGSPTFRGMAGSNLQVFGHPGQGLPMSVPRAPVVPFVGQAPIISAVGLNSSRMGIHVEAPRTPPTFHPDVAAQNKNSQLIHDADISNSINQTSSKLQATKKDFDQSAMTSKPDQAPNVCAAAAINLTNTTDVKSTKEVG